jgi:hypothetical protein
MNDKLEAARMGAKTPDFLVQTAGKLSLHQLAARYERLVLTTQDSYRYHPN